MKNLINEKAPNFNTTAVIKNKIVKNFNLSQFRNKKYIVLFFYPKDFTYICPTEIHGFQKSLNEFYKRNTEVIGISTDSAECHLSWLNIDKKLGGIKGVTFPLLSDINKTISYKYNVLCGDVKLDNYNKLIISGELISNRATFIIDKNSIIRHISIYDLSIGRNINEIIRIIDAIKHVDKYGNICPVNWDKNKSSMKPNIDSVIEYLDNN